MDKLDAIFRRQRKLAKKYGVLPIKRNKDLRKHVKSMALAMIAEVCEIIDEKQGGICVKDWRGKIYKYDKKYVKFELADLLHFFVELCLLIGVTPNELYKLYMRKSNINKIRISTGYNKGD